MRGYISSWKSGNDTITSCPDGDAFPFTPDGVADPELSSSLEQSGPFVDSGPCAGQVPVQFAAQSGFAVDIVRLKAQVSWQEF
jgi:hypothetical protein